MPSCYDGFGHTHILRDFWLLPRVIYEILRLSILNLFEQAPWKEKNPGILEMVASPVALLHHCIGIQSKYKQAMFKACCMRLNAESRMRMFASTEGISGIHTSHRFPMHICRYFQCSTLATKWIVKSFRSKNNNNNNNNKQQTHITKRWFSQRPAKVTKRFWPASTTIKPNQQMRIVRKLNAWSLAIDSNKMQNNS